MLNTARAHAPRSRSDRVMKPDDALALAKRCAPKLGSHTINSATARSIASLWAGMGSVEEIKCDNGLTFCAKVVRLPKNCSSVGDSRKAAS